MRARSAWIVPVLVCLMAGPASAQVSFQQNSYGLAVPPFGGYAPEAGITFGFGTGGNPFVQQNGFGQAVPPFGGFAPDAGLNFGFGSAGFGVNFSAAQGSRSSLSGQAVTGTLSNGVPMSVAESSQTPFVLGVIPVVAQGGASPLAERMARLRQGEKPGARGGLVAAAAPKPEIAQPLAQAVATQAERKAAAGGGGGISVGPSSAERPARSVAEIRRAQQQSAVASDAESEAATRDLIARAAQAAAEGKTSVARVYYQQAMRRATGPLKEQVQERLDALR